MLVLKAHVSLAASSDINEGNEVSEHGTVGYARVRRLRHAAPDRATAGDLHAIGSEVESNEIRLLRLMLRLEVKAGTADGGTRSRPLERLAVVTILYAKAKFIQKWDGHANTCYGGGSGLDYHGGICADAAYATICLCDRSDHALCLCDWLFESLPLVIRAKSILER